MKNPENEQEVLTTRFNVLSHLAAQPGFSIPQEARPVVFELLPDKKVCWSFNPTTPQQLFNAFDIPDAPLRIWCEGKLLLRLLSQEFEVLPGETIGYQGDLKYLKYLIQSLERKSVFSFGEET